MSLQFCVDTDLDLFKIVETKVLEAFGDRKPEIVHIQSQEDRDRIKCSNSSRTLVLVINGAPAIASLKDLCDDFASPTRRVRLIYSLSAGMDVYRLTELKTELKGIPICNARGCFASILAEHVVFSMLYFNRFPWRLLQAKKEKKWERFSVTRLNGQKLGIIGYGNIGEECGRMATQMGLQVTAIKRSTPPAPVDQFGVTIKGEDYVDQLLAESDFILAVLPATEATKNYFNKSVFQKMKPSAVFINIGRGSTQNENDLVEALAQGTIRGATLDVFEVEPLPPSSPVWSIPDDKILLTPHCADVTDDLIHVAADRMVDIVKELLQTNKVSAYTVSTETGY